MAAGPDAYRDLPRLLRDIDGGAASAMNVQLSLEETYADLAPVRGSGVRSGAFVSITRGCNNMCSFCIVPFTRCVPLNMLCVPHAKTARRILGLWRPVLDLI